MADYNGQKRSLTLQVTKLENGVEVSTTNYDGLQTFTWETVVYPTITSAALMALSDVAYAARLAAFEAYVGNEESITVADNIEEGYEAVISDEGMCPLPSSFKNITAIANVDLFGTVTGGGTYLVGSSCTITAVAKPGFAFSYWEYTLNGVAQANVTQAIHTFVVSEAASFTAIFEPYVVTTYKVSFSNHVCQIV